MIGLMSKSFTDALKTSGYVKVSPYDGWNIHNMGNICAEMPFKIEYVGYDVADVQKLFDIVLTLTNKFMVVKDIDINKDSIFAEVKNKTFLKSLTYAWLGLSIEALESFGSTRGKTKISLRCNLPGTADILLDRGYKRIHRDGDRTLTYSELFEETRDSNKYVGIKDLK